MRAAKFDYHRPGSVDEAVQLLSSEGELKALAGGHSLLPAMNLRLAQPQALVDIGRLEELKGIRIKDNALLIGALATHAAIADSVQVQQHCPALADACGHVGDPQVRNWGTLGGNLAHADPASDPPAVILASGASIHLQGPDGRRSVAADDFFLDLFATDLRSGELITAIEVPSLSGRKSAYVKLANPASRYAMVGICVVLEWDGSSCKSARVAVTGAMPKAVRSAGAETGLSGSSLDEAALEQASEALQQDLGEDVLDDIHAPRDYRRAMTGVYLKRAVRAALSG